MNVNFSELNDTSPAALGVWAVAAMLAEKQGTPGRLLGGACWIPERWAAVGLDQLTVLACSNLAVDGLDLVVLGVGADPVAATLAPKKTALQIRAEKLFRRRESTAWGKAEKKAWEGSKDAVATTTEEDWKLLEWWFSLKGEIYRRQDLATLLNNWNAEIDRARGYQARSRGGYRAPVAV